jgi:hypothetical protein
MKYVLLKKSKEALGLLVLTASLTSCSLKSNGQQQMVTIALPGANFSLMERMEKLTQWLSLAWASSTTTLNLNSDPASLSEFDCFGVNVSGPGINPNPNVTCSNPVDAPAILGGFVPNGNSSIDLAVPAGPDRSIKVFGVKSLIGCPSLRDMLHDGSINFNNIGHFYDIGGTHTDIFNDSVVGIKVTYNSSTPTRTFSQCQRTGEGANSSAHLWAVYAGTGPGQINATKTIGKTAYVGGQFDYVGPNTHSGVMVSQLNGAIAGSTMAHINGTVRCATPDLHGGFFVGGQFTRVDNTDFTVSTPNQVDVIHILADGSFDSGFVVRGNSGSGVYACAFNGTELFVGGQFTSLKLNSGTLVTSNSLAAVDVSTGVITNLGSTFDTAANIFALSIDSTLHRLYIGGAFTFSSTAHKNALALSTLTGTVVSGWNPDPAGSVLSILADSSTGDVYLGGLFTTPTPSYLWRVDSNGAIDTSWAPSIATLGIDAIAQDSASNIYVASRISGGYRQVVRIDAGTSNATTLIQTSSSTDRISALALSSDSSQLFVGGRFVFSGRQNVLVISTPASTAVVNPVYKLSTNTATTGVYAIATNEVGRAYVGGDFDSYGGYLRTNFAALSLDTGEATGWGVSIANCGPTTAMDWDGTNLYASCAAFSSYYPKVMKLSMSNAISTPTWTSQTASSSDVIHTIALNGGKLYVGGSFASLAGTGSLTSVARLDLATGVADTWAPALSTVTQINQFLFKDNTVYIGGLHYGLSSPTFLSKGLIGVDLTTAATASTWTVNPSLNLGVSAMTFDSSATHIIAATSNGTNSVIKVLDLAGNDVTSTYWSTAPDVSTTSQIFKMVLSGNTLFMGGQSNGAGNQALFAYDMTTQAMSSTFQTRIANYNQVNSLESTAYGTILVGGNFRQVDVEPDGTLGKEAMGIALFDALTGVYY